MSPFQQPTSNNGNGSTNFDRGGKNRASERYPVPNKKKVGNPGGSTNSENISQLNSSSSQQQQQQQSDKENVTPRKVLAAASTASPLSPSRSMDSGLNTNDPLKSATTPAALKAKDWVFATPDRPISSGKKKLKF